MSRYRRVQTGMLASAVLAPGIEGPGARFPSPASASAAPVRSYVLVPAGSRSSACSCQPCAVWKWAKPVTMKRAKLGTLILLTVALACSTYSSWRPLVFDDTPQTWNREQLEVVYNGAYPLSMSVGLNVSYTASSDPDRSDRGAYSGALRINLTDPVSRKRPLQGAAKSSDGTADPGDSDASDELGPNDTSDESDSDELPARSPGLAAYLHASPRIAAILDNCIASKKHLSS